MVGDRIDSKDNVQKILKLPVLIQQKRLVGWSLIIVKL